MKIPVDWRDPTYLIEGTGDQQRAYATLRELGLPEALAPYRPILAGTVPLGVAIPGSDLDILCEARDLESFATRVTELYGHRRGFTRRFREKQGLPAYIGSFETEAFPIEIFAQSLPVEQQNGYRHMVVEARLLALASVEAAEAIRELKRQGLKTEPAFARCFGLPGDPYEALLHLAGATDDALRRYVAVAHGPREREG